MNSTHRVNIVKIDEIMKHPNADTLGIVYIGGYQVVVKLDDFKVGDLAIYIQPDTIVPVMDQFKFLWADREFSGEVPEKYRRITVRRFRKEWSEGMLTPLAMFGHHEDDGYYDKGLWIVNEVTVGEGDDVAELLGFTHYEETDPTYALGTQGRKLTLWQRILKFFGYAPKPFGPKDAPGVYDVESVKNYPRAIAEGEVVIATEKIHGSNARYYFDGKQFWVGSHKKWWKDKTNIFWRVAEKNEWIEAFCRDNPKHTLRGEVTPTQTGYQYGNTPEEQFFAFDVQRPDGTYVDKIDLYMDLSIYKLVPVVYQGPYDATKLKELAEGKSLVDGATNIREGLVISTARERSMRGLGRVQLKLKSMAFLEKENKQK
jgi:hypothetical protein